MSKFTEYIGKQFGNPHGFVGKVCCAIMNIINKAMYRKTVSLLPISDNDNVLDICSSVFTGKQKLIYMA